MLGDVNVSLIRTARGRTIYVSHDTNLPRPYSRITWCRARGTPSRAIRIASTSRAAAPSTAWDEPRPYLAEYDHPFWPRSEEER